MKNIRAIFRDDIKALRNHFFVLIITLGLCILPALYAWFNIYSNWDPYGNTGNIKIAVASQDQGYTHTDGSRSNIGEQLLDTLQENDSIDWVITSEKNVKKGIRRGDYYAGIILPANFSSCIYDGMLHGLQKPELTYYVNDKKNAVATKITDTAVSNLQNNINEMYISILVSTVFEKENIKISDLEQKETFTQLKNKIKHVSDTLADYTTTTDAFTTANTKLSGTIQKAQSDLNSIQNLAQNKDKTTNENLLSLPDTLRTKNHTIYTNLSHASLYMKQAIETETLADKRKYYQKAINHLKKTNNILTNIQNALPDTALSTALDAQNKQLQTKINTQIQAITKLNTKIKSGLQDHTETLTGTVENTWYQTIQTVCNTYETILMPLMEETAVLIETIQKDMSNAVGNIQEDVELLNQIFTGATESIDSSGESLTALSRTLQQTSEHLNTLNETIDSLSSRELLQKALSFMQGDPESYGTFFASPIQMDTKRIYPVENYGSGVTPFYTTLALWVGGIFLVSLIRVKPDSQKYVNAKPQELFFGRFLLFAILGQLQTLIIVIGNLALLHTQCLLPKHFWFACALTSLTFMLLIFAFTVSFGDIGKAMIVVFVVLQIAGSSGTFPIEILPEFYRKIYIFFPFPYAINAMREAICGMNGNDYIIYLIQLSLFAIAALLLGLVIRLPFRGVSHFVEKRMEDTGMM